jgi:hypothetical protein
VSSPEGDAKGLVLIRVDDAHQLGARLLVAVQEHLGGVLRNVLLLHQRKAVQLLGRRLGISLRMGDKRDRAAVEGHRPQDVATSLQV